ncbi:hypothetical protein Tco_0191223 [Tanacetum coccineum]
MANVPITPYGSPIPGGYTPRSDEGRMKLQELMTIVYKIVKTYSYAGREKVPTDQELLEKMLNLQLEAEEESIMAFELIKFIKSMLEE